MVYGGETSAVQRSLGALGVSIDVVIVGDDS